MNLFNLVEKLKNNAFQYENEIQVAANQAFVHNLTNECNSANIIENKL